MVKVTIKANKASKQINNSFVGGESFDRDDKSMLKFMKKHHCSLKKSVQKQKVGLKIKETSNKVISYKHNAPKAHNITAYEHKSYIEDLQRMHGNIEDMMKNKVNLKFETKRKKASAGGKKRKHKRSVTPALAINH